MKKLIKYITFMPLVLILFSGCEDLKFGNDFLEKRTSTDVSMDEVYSKKVYAEQALAEVYRRFQRVCRCLDGLNIVCWNRSLIWQTVQNREE